MVKQDERTDQETLEQAIRQAETSLETGDPWAPAVNSGLRSYTVA